MAALFGHGNPLTTQVGQLIERATDGSQASENWALFLEICDIINETEEGPKDAIKAIKKRLSQNVGKNYTAVLYTLTCLETCVKNCGRRFHVLVANKDFLHDLIKIIGPKNDPPQGVQEKVLNLIQTWADAFRSYPELKEVEKIYQELKSKGIEFPMTDLDNLAPIHTPARSVPATETHTPAPVGNRGGSVRSGSVRSPGPPQPVVEEMPQVPVSLNTEQSGKLRRELDVVSGNVRVMSEMLTELTPTNCDSSDLELLQELNRTCRQMQQRVVELLNHVANEEITNELLRVNDELNNVFLRYERFERYRTGQAGQGETTPVPQSPPPAPSQDHLPPSYDQIQESSNPNVGNLIDFGEEDSSHQQPQLHEQLAGINVNASSVQRTLGNLNRTSANTAAQPPAAPPPAAQPPQHDDFDMFAQSRQSFEQSKQSSSASASASGYRNQSEDQRQGGLSQAVASKVNPEDSLNAMSVEELEAQLQDKESDYDEMEKWLATHEAQRAGAGGKSDPVSSSEFDSFLAERAAAADRLPSIPAATGGQQQSRPGPRTNRQLKKDDEDNPLFAL